MPASETIRPRKAKRPRIPTVERPRPNIIQITLRSLYKIRITTMISTCVYTIYSSNNFHNLYPTSRRPITISSPTGRGSKIKTKWPRPMNVIVPTSNQLKRRH